MLEYTGKQNKLFTKWDLIPATMVVVFLFMLTVRLMGE